MRSVETGDDARRPVPLLNIARYRRSLGPDDRRGRALCDRLRRALGVRSFLSDAPLALLNAVPVLLIVLTSFAFLAVFGPCGLILVLVAAPAGLRTFFGESRASTMHREATASLVAEGLCASCGYRIDGLEPDNARLLTCPECGAVWAADRVVAPLHDDEAGELPDVAPASGRPILERAAIIALAARRPLMPDARRRIVPVLDRRLLSLDPADRASLRPDVRRTLLRALARPAAARRWLLRALSVLIAVPGAVAATQLAADASGQDGSSLGTRAIAGLVAVAVLAVGWSLAERFTRSPSATVRELTARGRCPVCLADLRGLPTEADGVVVCRGCAASWRVGDQSAAAASA